MIDDLLKNFGLDNVEHLNMLRNIAEFHHEAVNGKGYPSGKKGDEIPLEARIIAVADVFDALTSKRPYKDAWDNQRAIEMLKKLAGETLDQDCVDALVNKVADVAEAPNPHRQEQRGQHDVQGNEHVEEPSRPSAPWTGICNTIRAALFSRRRVLAALCTSEDLCIFLCLPPRNRQKLRQ